MTTPSDEPAAEQPAQQPAQPAESPAESPTAPTAAAAPPPLHSPPPYVYPDSTFAPVARPARAPWVNPAKRAPVAIAAGLIAVVLLGGGFAAGYAAGHHNRDGVVRVRFQPGDRNFPGMPMGPGYQDRRDHMYPNLPTPSTTPSPSSSG